MTQPSWNQFENQQQDLQKQDYAKRAASQLPYQTGQMNQASNSQMNNSMGGWLNNVMPEKINEMNSYHLYSTGQNVSGLAPQQNAYSHNPQNNQVQDVHSLHQRIDDLSQTIARMEKSTPASNMYATQYGNSFSGQNRRSDLPVPYAGQMRRVEELQYGNRVNSHSSNQPYISGGAGQFIGQNADLVNQLMNRLDDAERQAREAWRVAQTAQNLASAVPKINAENTKNSAITRAEKILAAADETARKTLALINAQKANTNGAEIAQSESLEKENAMQSLLQQMNDMSQKIQGIAEQNAQAPKEIVKEVIIERGAQNEEMIEALHSQIHAMSEKLHLISSEIGALKLQSSDSQAIEMVHLNAVKDSLHSDTQIEQIQTQIQNLAIELENSRMEDGLVLDRLVKIIQTANHEESQTREKILQELSSVKMQEALVSNEVEDISAKLEQQLQDIKAQISQPNNNMPVMEALQDIKAQISQPNNNMPVMEALQDIKAQILQPNNNMPVMEALQDIYSKIESLENNEAGQSSAETDAMIMQMMKQLHEIKDATTSDDTTIKNILVGLNDKIEVLSHKISEKSADNVDESFIIEQLEQHLNAIRSSMLSNAQYQDLNTNVTEIRTVIHALDQRFFLLSDAVEMAANQLKTQNLHAMSHNGESQDLSEVIAKINQLQEQLVDAPAKMGIASMEYQLHQLDQKIENLGDNADSSEKAAQIQNEIQTLKSIIENNSNAKSFSKLERDIEDLHILLENNNAMTSNRAMGELISTISRLEMGISQLTSSNGMNSVLKGFDSLNANIVEARNFQEKTSYDLHKKLDAALSEYSNVQTATAKSLLSEVTLGFEGQSEKISSLISGSLDGSTENIVKDLSATIHALHNEIRAEIQALADMPVQVDLGELASVPQTLENLSFDFKQRLSQLEEKIIGEFPVLMNAVLHQEASSVSAHLDNEMMIELSAIRKELSELQTTLNSAVAQQNSAVRQELNDLQISISSAVAQQNSVTVPHNIIQSLDVATQYQERNLEELTQSIKEDVEGDTQQNEIMDNISIFEVPRANPKVSNIDAVFLDELSTEEQVRAYNPEDKNIQAAPIQASAIEIVLTDHLSQKFEEKENVTSADQEISSPLDLLNVVNENYEAPQHAQKQDFIAAARKAAQSAALEANVSSLITRARKIELDPFEASVSEESKGSILGAGKSILSKIGFGPKAEKQHSHQGTKLNAAQYVAPVLDAKTSNMSEFSDDELLEPESEKSSALKKTMMMSASAALIAAGSFGYLTTKDNMNQNTAGIDSWNSGDITASIPETALKKGELEAVAPALAPIENQKEIEALFAPNAAIPIIDGAPSYDQLPSSKVEPSKTYEHLDQANLQYKPYEMVAGMPVPPMIVGQKTAQLNPMQQINNAHSAQQTAMMQFKMPLEAIGSARLRTAAAQGNPSAMLEIANRYVEGRGVARDVAEAISWFQRAADAGSAPAQYRLGSFYEKGYGVGKDIKKAASFYEKSAIVGNRKAMHNLAVLYAEGVSGKPNFELSLKWFREASDRGLPDSQFNLGVVYARGLGVKQDLVESYKWFAIAAESGDQEAAKKRDEVAAKMDPKMVHWAKSAVRLFQPKELDSLVNDGQMPFETWDEMPAGKLSAVQSLKRVA